MCRRFKTCTFKTCAFLLAFLTVAKINSVFADTLFGISVSAGQWFSSADGSMGTDSTPITTGELGIENNQSTILHLSLEHPIPVLPNVRAQHSIIEHQGTSIVTRDFTLETVAFPAQARTETSLDLTQTDITLYYEILDNWVSFDVGLTAKMMNGSATIEAPDVTSALTEKVSIEGTIPMFYVMAGMELPFSSSYAVGHLNYAAYDSSTVRDIDLKIGWMYDSILNAGFELGYRSFAIELVDMNGSDADLTYQGPYVTLVLHN